MSCTLSKSLIRLHRCQNAITTRSLQVSKSLMTQSNTCVSQQSNSNGNNITAIATATSINMHKFSPIPKFQVAQFSTKPEVESTASSTSTITIDATNANSNSNSSSSSVLSTLPENYTPGHAWGILQKHLAGHNKVRLDDFISLCNASRPMKPKDAKVIRTALLDLKRCNDFYISVDGAHAAIDGMMRSLSSDSGLDSTLPEFKVKAGIYVARVFGLEDAGLYVAVDTKVLNENLFKVLLSGVENYTVSVDADVDTDTDVDVEEGDGESSEKSESLLAQAAAVAKNTVDVLLTRASNPTKDMKKRKKREYLKYLKCSSGPTPETIDLAVKICLKHDDENEGIIMANAVLGAYKECPHLGSAEADTLALVQDAEARVAALKLAEAADEETKDDDGDDDDSEGK